MRPASWFSGQAPRPERYGRSLCAALALCIIAHCLPKEKHEPIDYLSRVAIKTVIDRRQYDDTTALPAGMPRLSAVVASIYSAHESYTHFQELFTNIGKKCGVAITIRYSKCYNDAFQLFNNDSADIGIVSPSLYIMGKRAHSMRLLVTPVINNKITGTAYIIVRKDSDFNNFYDLKNSRFAFTDTLSLMGYFYPRHRCFGKTGFWQKTLLAGSHDNAIDLVFNGLVDGASVAGHVYDFISSNFPEKTGMIRIIEKSEEFGLPPIVIGNRMSAPLAASLKNAFLSLPADTTDYAMLRSIGIDGFVTTSDSLYLTAEKLVP